MEHPAVKALRDQIASVHAELDQAQANLDLLKKLGRMSEDYLEQNQIAIDRRRGFARFLEKQLSELTAD